MNKKFKINEKVRVYTKFYTWQKKFWLPDEVLYFGMYEKENNTAVISWHGTIHRVNFNHIYKVKKP